jgi:hypothetical protein
MRCVEALAPSCCGLSAVVATLACCHALWDHTVTLSLQQDTGSAQHAPFDAMLQLV